MAECKIMRCDCKNESQDSMYGNGMRLWNPIGKGKDQGENYRCTVCNKSTNGSIRKKK